MTLLCFKTNQRSPLSKRTFPEGVAGKLRFANMPGQNSVAG